MLYRRPLLGKGVSLGTDMHTAVRELYRVCTRPVSASVVMKCVGRKKRLIDREEKKERLQEED
jgi:hypothetical protein